MDLLVSNIWYSIFIGSSTVQRFNLPDYQQLLIRQIKLDSSDAASAKFSHKEGHLRANQMRQFCYWRNYYILSLRTTELKIHDFYKGRVSHMIPQITQ